MPVYHAMDALPYLPFAEVDHEREPEVAQTKVGESLGLEQAIVGGRRLALHDDKVVDQQVEAKVGGQPLALVYERDGLLSGHRQSARFELEGQRLLVHDLEQPWPSERAMNLDRRSDDDRSYLILLHSIPVFLRPCVSAPLR